MLFVKRGALTRKGMQERFEVSPGEIRRIYESENHDLYM